MTCRVTYTCGSSPTDGTRSKIRKFLKQGIRMCPGTYELNKTASDISLFFNNLLLGPLTNSLSVTITDLSDGHTTHINR